MAGINETSIEQIENLKDIELSELLHTLLHCEAAKYIPGSFTVSVPFNITTADAGSDGRAQWSGTTLNTPYLPKQYCIFQNKATVLGPADCYDEILVKEVKGNPRKLKGEIEKVVTADGCYILFTNRPLTDTQKNDRISKFREAIRDAGHKSYDKFHIDIYDANVIKDWTNQYITAILKVQRYNNMTRPLSFRIWEEFGQDIREKETTYQLNDQLAKSISSIRAGILEQKVYRIHGHSGLGKTRFIYETFRPVNSEVESLKNLSVYFDADHVENLDEVVGYIISHRDKQNGIIVIDNCTASSHIKLSAIIKPYNGLKLITVGLDDDREINDRKIKLIRDNQKDLILEIIDEKLKQTHTLSEREYLASVCEGYPWMAVRFSEQVSRLGLTELNKYPIDSLIKKLLFEHNQRNDEDYDIIRACSVFSSFGFLDDSFQSLINDQLADTLQKQMDFIREKIYDGSITDSKFREICNKYKEKDIIEKKSVYYSVKPTVLAIHLSASWLMTTSPRKVIDILEKLQKVQLDTRFLERLSELDQIDKAKDLVGQLWGMDGFFGKAEVLKSEWGSLLFRHVVEVNPIETMNSLTFAFGQMSITELRSETASRRNLVWALEKLAFRKTTFSDAAKMLYTFAVAENETWANNATGQFRQLFQLRLAGTEASLEERLPIIKWGLLKNDDNYERIAILAIATGLDNHNFHRSGGAEKQGSSAPLQDYHPSNQETVDYRQTLLSMLLPIAKKNSPNGQIARKEIAKNLRILIRDGFIEQMEAFIKEVAADAHFTWPEMGTALRKAMSYEAKNVPEIKDRLQLLLETLMPTDFRNQLQMKVSKPEWFDYSEDFGDDIVKKNAELIAEKIVSENIDLTEYLQDLLIGEQRMGFVFGKKLGEILVGKKEFIDKAIEELEKIPVNEQNPEIIAGFALGTKDVEIVNGLYSTVLASNSINHNAFYLARVLNINITDLFKLFALVDAGKVDISYFLNFKYGKSLSAFQNEDVIEFCLTICKYPSGNWVALSLLYMYCYENESNWQYCTPAIKSIIVKSNMIIEKNIQYQMDTFHWSSTIEKLLESTNDSAFAKQIMQQLIEASSQRNYDYNMEPYLPKIYKILFDKYFDETWEYLGNALISKNYLFILHINRTIGAQKGHNETNGILFENPDRFEKLLEWCKTNPEEAPKRMAHMMPVDAKSGDNIEWHPFAKMIIDNFGNDKSVLENLSANIGTYTSIGSSVEYLQSLYWLMTLLRDHPIDLVRIWANSQKNSLQKEIKLEELDNEGELPR
ncbi:hypothetical protein [Sediminibacterium ginsengisoli]|uniref:Uncharacterized protein n=1 Tax=Sediminibacterium ginsengisoli TaxID=413434 RepID=A0A1T4NZF5_9BACT|nr:hypothetical protein [Sediminibacterium ginsengisoli]SJZ84633.1 hypothetical protein SAMN04488132_10568 [Sediminibacterium ginsengisoli]